MVRVFDALKSQTLDRHRWEILLVDNASDERLCDRYVLSWYPNATHLLEGSARRVRAAIFDR